MALKKELIEGQFRHIGGILGANGKAGQKLVAKLLDFHFREGRLAKRLRKQNQQKRQIFNKGAAMKSRGVDSRIKPQTCTHRFEFVIETIETVLFSAAH